MLEQHTESRVESGERKARKLEVGTAEWSREQRARSWIAGKLEVGTAEQRAQS
jgi:hypothetical protein